MMPSKAKPALYSLPRSHAVWRVIDYLHLHRSEVLNRHDIAVKFEIAAVEVDDVLRPAVDAKMLTRARDSENALVWRRPRQLQTELPTPFSAARQAVRAPKIDLASIVIEQGIALTDPLGQLPYKWSTVFSRMQPGDSFKLPSACFAAVSHAKLKYSRELPGTAFALRKLDNDTMRVWRTA